MSVVKQFKVFGEQVDILVPKQATNGTFCILVQHSPPGGGPPPHVHINEDEIFTVLEGDFEVFDGSGWTPVPVGQPVFKLRGQVHTFRNCGETPGRMQCICTPGGLDEYLEKISAFEIPRDMELLIKLSADYGIRFLTAEPPTAPPI